MTFLTASANCPVMAPCIPCSLPFSQSQRPLSHRLVPYSVNIDDVIDSREPLPWSRLNLSWNPLESPRHPGRRTQNIGLLFFLFCDFRDEETDGIKEPTTDEVATAGLLPHPAAMWDLMESNFILMIRPQLDEMRPDSHQRCRPFFLPSANQRARIVMVLSMFEGSTGYVPSA